METIIRNKGEDNWGYLLAAFCLLLNSVLKLKTQDGRVLGHGNQSRKKMQSWQVKLTSKPVCIYAYMLSGLFLVSRLPDVFFLSL